MKLICFIISSYNRICPSYFKMPFLEISLIITKSLRRMPNNVCVELLEKFVKNL